MTPREIELLTIAKLEHDGHQLTPADQREIERTVNADIVRRNRFRDMMRAPAYQWKKPVGRRRPALHFIDAGRLTNTQEDS